jgi:Asp-tRNA(Asn)/Glu-tRNA(Gln) amidotransferase A subunit family amidase
VRIAAIPQHLVRRLGDHPTVSCRPLFRASLAATAVDLRTGKLEVSVYLEQVRARMEQVDGDVQAFVPEADRWHRVQHEIAALAARTRAGAERPPLYGVAVGVKDCFRVDGLPTRAGSELPPELFAGREASAVTALRAAGAIILGKTAMDEFAYSEPAATRNPHNLAHTPGGSSSGSAAAVAAGICPLALGTQTSRSVIGPAAFCGVVGFKPSFGRIGIDGVIPLSPSFDTVGMFTQDVAGMRLAASALIPDWRPIDAARRPVLGVPEGKFLTWTLEVGRQAFEEHLARLSEAGFEIRRIPFFADDELEEMDRLAMTLLHGEMARVHAEWFRRYPDRYRPRTARAIQRGQVVGGDELTACRAHGQAFRAQVEVLMRDAGIDLWVTPASAGPAPFGLELTGWGGMTTAWSYAGLPCVTIPAGRDPAGLPLGLQAIAPIGQDEQLLAWTSQLETAFAADFDGGRDP